MTYVHNFKQLHLQTKLISIKRTDCTHTPDYFGYIETQIERGAKLFLEAKGIINPLLVRRTNNIINGVIVDEDTPDGRYQVVSGFLEYFCAKRAKEINNAQEYVQAIVINDALLDNLLKQIELFRVGMDSIEPDNYWGDEDGELDFVLDEVCDIEQEFDQAVAEKSLDNAFAAAEKLYNLYPDAADRDNAIADLEQLKVEASGSKSARAKLDAFFAEAKGLYE